MHSVLEVSEDLSASICVSMDFIVSHGTVNREPLLSHVRCPQIGDYLAEHLYESIDYSSGKITKESGDTIFKLFPGIKNYLEKISDFQYYSVSSESFRMIAAFSSLLPADARKTFTLTNTSGALRIEPARPINKILVITNREETLSHLQNFIPDVPSRNSLFEWDYLAAGFTQRKMYYLLEKKEYDLVIYRGHARVLKNRIAWVFPDFELILPPGIFPHYIHAGCLNNGRGEKELKELPFRRGFLPSTFIEDHDDWSWIQDFLALVASGNTFQQAAIEMSFRVPLQYWTYS